MAVLIINRSESRCSECRGSSVQWRDVTAHTESLGGWSGTPVEACGQPYTAVSSDYASMEDHIRALRPDLPWQPALGERAPLAMPSAPARTGVPDVSLSCRYGVSSSVGA